jgi:hypothetical protein
LTKGTRVAGGLIAIFAGIFILFWGLIDHISIFAIYGIFWWFSGSFFTLFITSPMSLVGGALLLFNKKYGAILALLSAGYYLIIGYVDWMVVWLGTPMISAGPLVQWPIHFAVLIGGILGLSGNDYELVKPD